MIPQNIINHFDEYHITLTWNELHERFGFDLKSWKQRFRDEFYKQPRSTSEVEFFLIFGNRFINPLLNDILGRRSLHPTFNKLVDYVIDKKRN
jgi:hypothetical protein